MRVLLRIYVDGAGTGILFYFPNRKEIVDDWKFHI